MTETLEGSKLYKMLEENSFYGIECIQYELPPIDWKMFLHHPEKPMRIKRIVWKKVVYSDGTKAWKLERE